MQPYNGIFGGAAALTVSGDRGIVCGVGRPDGHRRGVRRSGANVVASGGILANVQNGGLTASAAQHAAWKRLSKYERNTEVLAMHHSGASNREIAAKYGISAERVRQLIRAKK